MKIFSYWKRVTFYFLLCSLFSCINPNYITRPSAYARVIETGKADKSYFIMHSGVDVYRIKSIEVEKSKQQFTVQLDKLDSLHIVGMKNPKSLGDNVIYFQMKDSASYTLDEPHTIPLKKVARIEVVH